MTSLDMAGCSITLLRLDDELTALWDAPVVTTGPAVGRVSGDAGPGDGASAVRRRSRAWRPGCAPSPRRSRATATT